MGSEYIFQRNSRAELPSAFSGSGCYIHDNKGNTYLDGSGGAAVSCLGHSDEHVKNAIIQQAQQLSYAHTSFFTTEVAEKLATRLARLAPGDINRVYLVSSGSESIEAALKLARQYFVEIGQNDRRQIITRKQSYHGNTLGALASGGNQWRRKQFEPLLIDTTLISPCYEYRYKLGGETEEEYGLRIANELETEIIRLGESNVMAFLLEPVVGATAGAICPVNGYLKRVREICDKYGILLIFDEVMCGMGRTGSLFACDIDGVVPDILTIAKGLGAGYQPIGAMLCQDYIHDVIKNGSGYFQHGHTYLGHPIAAAAADAVLDRLVDDKLLEDVNKKGQILVHKLKKVFDNHPNIGDIRGRGLFIGIEIVENRKSKNPFDHSLNIAGKIKNNAFSEGLICYPAQGTIDGKSGDHVLIAPPFIISEEEINILVERLSLAIQNSISI